MLTWLLDGDPAIRWQVHQDLLDEEPEAVAAERARVACEGWGARLLALQDPEGTWAGALYSPKWTSTTYTLLLLQRLGLEPGHPQAVRATRLLWERAPRHDGGLTLVKTVREPETCITGMLVLLAAAFGADDGTVDETVAWLLGQQLPDGGWNCDTVRTGSQHGSFHTSITVLEALLAYEQAGGPLPVRPALGAGHRFFLDHRLYRSHRTGEVVDPRMLRFPFPPQWHFDVLRGLEHLRAAGVAPGDDRLADAVAVVRGARRADGRWPTHAAHPGRRWFAMDHRGPSRWATLRALRVLRWWQGGSSAPGADRVAASSDLEG